MARRPVKGHIALWLIGKSTDDPRVHDMLNTLAIYSFARLVGPSVYHYGQLVSFVPKVAYHAWKQPKTGRGVRVTSPHGESPVRWEYTKPRVSVATATRVPRAFGIGGLSWLSFGAALQILKPSKDWLFEEMAFMPEYEHSSF